MVTYFWYAKVIFPSFTFSVIFKGSFEFHVQCKLYWKFSSKKLFFIPVNNNCVYGFCKYKIYWKIINTMIKISKPWLSYITNMSKMKIPTFVGS